MKIALMSDLHLGYDNKSARIFEKFLIGQVEKIKDDPEGNKFDVLLLLGDISSDKNHKNLNTCFRLLRIYFPYTKIFAVRGNHDFWEAQHCNRKSSLLKIMTNQNEIAKKYSVNFLDPDVVFHLGVSITGKAVMLDGFDGFYDGIYPSMNDRNYICKSVLEELVLKQQTDFEKVITRAASRIKTGNTVNILMSHYPYYGEREGYDFPFSGDKTYFNKIVSNYDLFFHGHDHTERDFIKGFCRVVNPGGRQNSPKIKIVEI